MKLLTRKGFLIEEPGMSYLADSDPDLALAPLQAAACTYRIALGPRAGQKVLSLHTVPTREPPPAPVRCADEQGFSLHAEVCCAAHQRKKLGSQGHGWPCLARRGRSARLRPAIIPGVPVNAHTPSADYAEAPPTA
ncbi:MAG: hypothetical protein ACREX9_04125, partial [Gammaproteobacteria bacterium]